MRHPYLGLCGLLVTFVCSPAFPQQRSLITIDPNDFAPGQNISSATTGAQLLAMTYVPNPDPNFPGSFIVENLPSVFAQPVAAGCVFFAGPCAASGNLVLGYSPTTVPSAQAIFWGDANRALRCIENPGPAPLICDNPGSFFPVLRVNFSVPTDKVSALIAFGFEDPSEIDGFQAFDDRGHLLATCFGGVPAPSSSPPGCMTVVSRVDSSSSSGGWANFTITRPSADINFILVGGQGNDRPISQVQFDSPVSLQLAGLRARVQGVGPGKALANDAMLAQTYFGVGDITSACLQLKEFVDLVRAQSGKKIERLTAAQLLSTATALEVANGCSK
jgi:hypothetical protein